MSTNESRAELYNHITQKRCTWSPGGICECVYTINAINLRNTTYIVHVTTYMRDPITEIYLTGVNRDTFGYETLKLSERDFLESTNFKIEREPVNFYDDTYMRFNEEWQFFRNQQWLSSHCSSTLRHANIHKFQELLELVFTYKTKMTDGDYKNFCDTLMYLFKNQ